MLPFLDIAAIDVAAPVVFLIAWLGYHQAVEQSAAARKSLNRSLVAHRFAWMRAMIERENRVVDTTINASLQSGAAFFASTSLIAIGGSLALLRSSGEIVTIFGELPFGLATTRVVWEMKALGLAMIFVYAFFTFAWSYRLFNYSAILIGAVPPRRVVDPGTLAAAWRAASMNTVAGRHFNRGQRAFFFAVAYLGWFVSGFVLLATTACVLYVMWRRQFASAATRALGQGAWPDQP